MATQRARTTDIIASVEEYFANQWPDPSVQRVPTAHEAVSGESGTLGDAWVGVQWIGPEPNMTRPSYSWVNFDLRILCYSTRQDRLHASQLGDDFAELVHETVIPLLDRTDGTTELGSIQFYAAAVLPPQVDSRGVRASIVDVSAGVFVS